MTEWLPMLPAFATTVLLLWLPGLLVAGALGLRGVLLLGAAPAVTTAVLAVAAIVAPLLGLSWSLPVWAGGTVVAACLSLGVRVLAAKPWVPPGRLARPLQLSLWSVLLVAGGFGSVVLQLRRMVKAIGEPGMISQTYDANYHLNAVALMQQTRSGSSLDMTLATPGRSGTFYPAAWHDVVLTITDLSGVGIPEATNVLAIVVAALVWPVCIVALVRTVVGPRPVPLALAALLATLFPQFPNHLVNFGVLYPNLLSYAIVPVGLALVVELFRSRSGRHRLVPLTAFGIVGVALVLTQPNGVFALAFLSLPIALTVLGGWARMRWAAGGRSRTIAVGGVAGALAALLVVWTALDSIALVESIRSGSFWEPTRSGRQALWEVLSLSASHPTAQPQVLLAVAVIGGLVIALRTARWRWMSLGYAVITALYVMALAGSEPHRSDWTGFWYTDPNRLGALLPVLAVPLATLAAWRAYQWLVRTVRSQAAGRAPAGIAARWTPTVAVAVAVALGMAGTVVLGWQLPLRDSFQNMADQHSADLDAYDSEELLSADEYELLEIIGDVVPEGVTVAGNPWDGSAMVWAIAGREVLFPHTGMSLDDDRALIASSLRDAHKSPEVCDAVERLELGYVVEMGPPLWGVGGDLRYRDYAGLNGLVSTGVAEVVAEVGHAQLLRISACG